MITKELLNKNRVLTMSNNRKCNYLIVDVGRNTSHEDITTMIGINTQGRTNDILLIKTFTNKTYNELVNEAYWTCKEFDIKVILVDSLGFGIGFIDTFKNNINLNDIVIRDINIRIPEINTLQRNAYLLIEEDLKNGVLRFLQTPEQANNYYQKSFLGYSNIMNFHIETDKLINEFNNINFATESNGNIRLSKIDNNINISRLKCLLLYYSYSFNKNDFQNQYEKSKRINQYNINSSIFYKYAFKCAETEQIQVLFYYTDICKILQFRNIVQEKEFREIFDNYIEMIKSSRDDFEIRFKNGSRIKFVGASDNSRGFRYHYAVVDSKVDTEIFNNCILCKDILFDMDKEIKKLNDITHIEFIDM